MAAVIFFFFFKFLCFIHVSYNLNTTLINRLTFFADTVFGV